MLVIYETMKEVFLNGFPKYFLLIVIFLKTFYITSRFITLGINVAAATVISYFMSYIYGDFDVSLLFVMNFVCFILTINLPIYVAAFIGANLQQLLIMSNSLGVDTRQFEETEALVRLTVAIAIGYNLQSGEYVTLAQIIRDLKFDTFTMQLFLGELVDGLSNGFTTCLKYIVILFMLDILVGLFGLFLQNFNVNVITEVGKVIIGIYLVGVWLAYDLQGLSEIYRSLLSTN